VQQRTEELVEANEDLRKEVRERERAEQALVESESKLRHAQKMESIGRLAGGIAHDFNNLLTVMLSYCELVLVSLEEGDETREDVEEIKAAAERASKLTRQLLAFGRQQIFEVKVLDLNDLIEEMIPMLERLIGEDIVLDVTMSPGAGKVLADRGQLEQVLMNLVVNARDAMPTGGTLGIATGSIALDADDPTEHPELRAGRYARLRVTDTGTGMDAKTRARIFDPFFTTKPTGKGTGLGLSTAYGIVKQSEGAISVQSEVGDGSTFDVLLPETDQESEGTVVTPKKSRGRAGNETVLLVEDESQVREVIRSVLERNGYSVLEADGAERALELCEVHGVDVDLLLTDLVMPQMNGRQLAREILRRRPETKVLYMSGYASEVAVRMGIRDGDLDFLAKPILPGALVAKVREILVVERPRRSEPHPAARSSVSGRFARPQ
ncbi:MAG: response regulator, partial [Myxococcales bacterium]|nr:response regulator [Myxococcales bacterium]